MTEIDTAKLREIASAATPGPWHVEESDGVYVAPENKDDTVICDVVEQGDAQDAQHYGTEMDNAVHIAAFDPATALALLDEIDRLRALLRRASEALDPFVDVLGEDEPIGAEVKVTTSWGPCTSYTLTVGDLRTALTVALEIEETTHG